MKNITKIKNIIKRKVNESRLRNKLSVILDDALPNILAEMASLDYDVKSINEAKSETGINMVKKKLDALGVKYEMSKTDKVRPFKVIYKPINKSDQFYDKFEDIVDLFNLKGVVKSINEAYGKLVVSEGKFFRLPKELNAMWELKNSVDYIVGKHKNGDDYKPEEMKTIEEFIKKIKQSAKVFKDAGEVKGTVYEAKDMTFNDYLDILDRRYIDIAKAVKGENGSDNQILPTRGDILNNITMFRNYVTALKRKYKDDKTKLRFITERLIKNEASYASGYTVKGKTPYEFVNGAYAVLSAYLRDEELGPKGKKELQNIIKSLEYMRKYFFSKLSESVNEAMISSSGAKGLRIGNKIKTENGTYTITGFGSQTNATKDFEATNERGKKFNLRVSLRGASGIQVTPAPSLNFPEKEEYVRLWSAGVNDRPIITREEMSGIAGSIDASANITKN